MPQPLLVIGFVGPYVVHSILRKIEKNIRKIQTSELLLRIKETICAKTEYLIHIVQTEREEKIILNTTKAGGL